MLPDPDNWRLSAPAPETAPETVRSPLEEFESASKPVVLFVMFPLCVKPLLPLVPITIVPAPLTTVLTELVLPDVEELVPNLR